MGKPGKAAFLGEGFSRLCQKEQEYLRDLVRSLLHIQDAGKESAAFLRGAEQRETFHIDASRTAGRKNTEETK